MFFFSHFLRPEVFHLSFSARLAPFLLSPLCLFFLLCPMSYYSPADLVICTTSTSFRIYHGRFINWQFYSFSLYPVKCGIVNGD